MKKLFLIMLSCVFVLTGCGNDDSDSAAYESSNDSTYEDSDSTYDDSDSTDDDSDSTDDDSDLTYDDSDSTYDDSDSTDDDSDSNTTSITSDTFTLQAGTFTSTASGKLSPGTYRFTVESGTGDFISPVGSASYTEGEQETFSVMKGDKISFTGDLVVNVERLFDNTSGY